MPEKYLHCDGGCNNHTHSGGYGSFKAGDHLERLTHPTAKTSNEAEYLTLLAALRWLGANASGERWVILSDSQLVVNQVAGFWQARAHLKPLCAEAKRLYFGLENVRLQWTPRAEIAKVLGH